jgi:hypothetical protein
LLACGEAKYVLGSLANVFQALFQFKPHREPFASAR